MVNGQRDRFSLKVTYKNPSHSSELKSLTTPNCKSGWKTESSRVATCKRKLVLTIASARLNSSNASGHLAFYGLHLPSWLCLGTKVGSIKLFSLIMQFPCSKEYLLYLLINLCRCKLESSPGSPFLHCPPAAE